jgi:uncharacterized damage-inducible protein DinB
MFFLDTPSSLTYIFFNSLEGNNMETLKNTMAEMEKMADLFGAAIQSATEAALCKRPDAKNWSAKEIICHVRDTEEFFLNRFQMILSFPEPQFSLADAERWVMERQYLRNDAGEAISAFDKRRQETLQFVKQITLEEWERTCIHKVRGRMTLRDYFQLLANHDKVHLDQVKRALAGQP